RRGANRSEPKAMDVLANSARIEWTDAAITSERYPGALLRTYSLRVGRDLRDGLHRHERGTSRRAHSNRDARSHVVHHSHLTFRRQVPARTFCYRDVRHVHGVSNCSTHVANFF